MGGGRGDEKKESFLFGYCAGTFLSNPPYCILLPRQNTNKMERYRPKNNWQVNRYGGNKHSNLVVNLCEEITFVRRPVCEFAYFLVAGHWPKDDL
ncbi:hypothetical protein TNIN_286021 [Trichonephila inaurata madagascariensis]|uniref:Uncharacterized protein n=1 Tax=Trichonephila inaurata madagascariensis TaxID=2747483 RepID=A0A8X6MB77_9ARAC|nr:hypothetical protein TNIN_286021 [Trichonephila inaurata madagascariensis]